MTRPLSASAKQLARAAELAARHSLTVRVETDGTVVFQPPYLDAGARKRVADSVEEWRNQRNEGKARGRP